MKRRGRSMLWCLALAVAVPLAGCSHPGAKGGRPAKDDGPAQPETPPIKKHAVDELRVKIGAYVLPQDQGRLQVACPQGWDWASAPGEYVLGFHRKNNSLDDLPRMLLAAQESPFPDLKDVGESQLTEFVQAVSRALGDQALETPVTPVMAGSTACAVYVELVKWKHGRVPRLVVKTVVAGRLYTINLDVPEQQFAKYRDAAYAVAASIKVIREEPEPASS
jgi:hypothetical protein